MKKFKKTLAYILTASILTFAPATINAQENKKSLTITIGPSEELQKDIAQYITGLATDVDDDGKQDEQGYETLFEKLNIVHNKNQNLEESQKQIREYIKNLKTQHQLNEFVTQARSMFTEKDDEIYFEKLFEEYVPRMMEETERKVDELFKNHTK